MLDFPHTDDPLVAALQRLIQREGSYVAVADRIEASDQSLYQIAQMKPHSVTGKLKSVGPNLRRRLDQAFPGWMTNAGHVREATSPWPSSAEKWKWPFDRFPESYWNNLTLAERAIVEEAMFDAYDRMMARREQLRVERNSPTKALKPAA